MARNSEIFARSAILPQIEVGAPTQRKIDGKLVFLPQLAGKPEFHKFSQIFPGK